MVYPATDEIYEAMTAHELTCGIEAREDSSVLHVGINAKETSFEALYISRSDKNDVALRIYNLVKFPPEKLNDMLEAVSECNIRFRFLKLTVDTRAHSVDAAFDFTMDAGNLGECAYEMLVRSANVIDECYPMLMSKLTG